MKKLCYILISCFLLACNPAIETIEKDIHLCAPHPAPVAGAMSFAYNGEGYIFGGRLANDSLSNHLWRYNPQQDKWTDLGETPLMGRTHGIAAVVNNIVYIGLGHTTGYLYTDSCYLRDFWQYIPETNTWTRLPDYPLEDTNGCFVFTEGANIHIGVGYKHIVGTSVATFCTLDQIWTHAKLKRFPAPYTFGFCYAQVGNQYFMGTGFNPYSWNTWREFFPEERALIVRQDLPTKGRDFATACGTNSYLYVIGGQYFAGNHYHLYNDILRYDPKTDSWVFCGIFPKGALKMISFTIDGRVYFGLGEDAESKIQSTLYCLEEEL